MVQNESVIKDYLFSENDAKNSKNREYWNNEVCLFSLAKSNMIVPV